MNCLQTIIPHLRKIIQCRVYRSRRGPVFSFLRFPHTGNRPARNAKNVSRKESGCQSDGTALQVTFSGLYKYAGGTLIHYTVDEDIVKGYTAVIDGYTIINTYDDPPSTGDRDIVYYVTAATISLTGIGVYLNRKKRRGKVEDDD